MKHVLCCGEILYDFISATPGAGLAKTDFFERRPGGSPFNIAVGLARLGRKTGFLVKLGTDEFGLELKRLLLSEGLEPGYLVEGVGLNTTIAMAAIDTSGKAEFRFYRDHAADVSLTWDELPPIDPSDVGMYHFGSVSLCEPPASETYIRLFKKMKAAHVLTVLDPNIRPLYLNDKPDFKPLLMELIPEVDVLKMSDDDLAWITGEKDVAKGIGVLPYNKDGLVVVTEGPKGARALWRGQETSVPGFEVDVTETTGCGDAFMAGVMHRLTLLADDASNNLVGLEAAQLEDILRFSNACAAIVATRLGAANSMPRLEEVEKFLRLRKNS